MKRSIIALALLSITACQPMQQADNGDPGPFPENYKELIQAHLRTALKDPDSVKDVNIPAPYPAQAQRGLIWGGGYDHFYTTCITLNAKNSYGGYNGVTPYKANIKDGKIIGFFKGCNW